MPSPKEHQDTGRNDSFHLLNSVRCMPVRCCLLTIVLRCFEIDSLIHVEYFYLFCLVLFQMALIPFTMSRYTIATFSKSKLNKYLPLDKSLRIHIHLGYTMVSIVFSATIVFFIFFGLSCSEGEQAFCDKFTSEIMITGYCILGLLVTFSIHVSTPLTGKIREYPAYPTLTFIFTSFSLLSSCSWQERRSFDTQFHMNCFMEFTSSSLLCMHSQLVSIFCMMFGPCFAIRPRRLIIFFPGSRQHTHLTLRREAGRKTEAKRSSGSLHPSYIIFAIMQ